MARKSDKSQFTTYSNLARSGGRSPRALKKASKARARAEYLATLPKNPFLRFCAYFEPKRMFRYWFSLNGLKMLGKIIGITLVVLVVGVGGMILYYRQQLNSIDLVNLEKNVQTTVSDYYDRNGQLLWEDTGSGNYRLVVPSNQINKYMKDATVAIEDKNFYHENGVSVSGIFRAFFNNTSGGGTQGASTLTQQLIKQVYFADQAGDRGIGGIPRKIKEAILSVEADRMYSKDQILTMYLNESPYGGRRNGVESAAQTYFGIDASQLNLSQAALLASIPQSPTTYNPYNTIGNNDLLARQHTVLDHMAEQGYITDQQASDAKNVAILDQLKPADADASSAKAPHFIQMVKQELIDRLGSKVVGQGGLKITTTLDIRVQNVIEGEMNQLFNGRYASYPKQWRTDNASMVMENNNAQILGLVGSRGYNYPNYGAVNMATSFVQPGSSIKPLVYASLINNQTNSNGSYGAGSIIPDTPIAQSVYTTGDGKSVSNDDGRFHGNTPLAVALGNSYNIPAIKAMNMNGPQLASDGVANPQNVAYTWKDIRDAGDAAYCTDGSDKGAGLASAIGGCGVQQVQHAAAFATLANNGQANPESTIIKVDNSQKQTIYQWKAVNKQVFDPQTAYIMSNILSTPAYRQATFGPCPTGECINGVKTATKTGTSNIGDSSKDIWMMSYTPTAVLSIWAGNHTPTALRTGIDGISLGFLINDINTQVYQKIFEPDGTYKANQWFTQPAGIQNIGGYLYPSWYSKNKATTSTVPMMFDKVSKMLSNKCTPQQAQQQLSVTRTVEPTGKVVLTASDGYNANAYDNVHVCGAQTPFFDTISASKNSDGTYTIAASFSPGDESRPIQSVAINYNGQSYNAVNNGTSWTATVNSDAGNHSVGATAVDNQYYSTDSGNQEVNFP
ncbi:MAG: transglycosylase domain-containing protein [Candidatus Nanoperiomorbaceae bacterium]